MQSVQQSRAKLILFGAGVDGKQRDLVRLPDCVSGGLLSAVERHFVAGPVHKVQ